jgi:hypothetical protein
MTETSSALNGVGHRPLDWTDGLYPDVLFPTLADLAADVGATRTQLTNWKRAGVISYKAQRGGWSPVVVTHEQYEKIKRVASLVAELKSLGWNT